MLESSLVAVNSYQKLLNINVRFGLVIPGSGFKLRHIHNSG